MDSAKDLRNATQALKEIQTKALKVLGDVKVQIEEDFIKTKVRQKEILNNLGFAAYTKLHNKHLIQNISISFGMCN